MPVRLTRTMAVLLAVVAAGVSSCGSPESDEYGSDGVCISNGSALANELRSPDSITVQWTPDGSRILFDYWAVIPQSETRHEVPDIYAVHVSGDPAKVIKDLPSRNLSRYGRGLDATVFDLSADGDRIAYAACALSKESVPGEDGDVPVYSYELFVVNFDGSSAQRLTNNTYFDVLPAWSPDGERLAYISDPDHSIFRSETIGTGRGSIRYKATTRITVHTVATGESREIGLPEGYAAAPIRLEWSPGGDRIAFVVLEGEKSPWNLAVYTVRVDGTGLTRLSDAISGPTWSPNGDSIAMIVDEGDDGQVIYGFAADGSEDVKEKYRLDHLRLTGRWGTEIGMGNWMGNLSWSPDGSAILVERFRSEGGPAVVPLETASVEATRAAGTDAESRAMTAGTGAGSILASPLNDSWSHFHYSAWSPDGTQIAVRYDVAEFFDLEVVDLEGNTSVLVEWVREYR